MATDVLGDAVGLQSRPNHRMGIVGMWFVTSLIGLVAWIVCETLGGLIFLAMGLRLWSYTITPIIWDIASYTGWVYVFFILGINCLAYLVWETGFHIKGPRRWLYRAIFLAFAGPVTEVIWNEATWNYVGTPLYLYTFLPTFSGSGSVCSPIYYQTLLVGFWLEEQWPGSLASLSR